MFIFWREKNILSFDVQWILIWWVNSHSPSVWYRAEQNRLIKVVVGGYSGMVMIVTFGKIF